jgi:hypothetical protein
MKAIKIYEDKAGNKLYKRFIKTRNVWQYSAKNREGKLVKYSEYKKLAKRAGLK